jgi:glycosyltransferase involved in cell wall biosynthesis
MRLRRLLFASIHSYIDPSSGAALATRDLLELLAARGIDCRALSAGVLDFEHETPLTALLPPLGVPIRRARAVVGPGVTAEVLDLSLDGVRVTLMPTTSSRFQRSPDAAESRAFLALGGQVLDRFRPQVLLTYGGHPANLALMAAARCRGIPVVFHLHNFGYPDRRTFDDVTAVLVPSEFSRRHHARLLGLDCRVLAYPLRAARVVAADPEPRYLTFVNPQPVKGLTVFARIASELDRHRPEISILVVEGRGGAVGLAHAGLDLSGLRNLHRMANTPDPRHFYRVSRAVLMPSLWYESFGRVAAEALANGIPVLASDRGALPETLGAAGFVLPVPARCTPEGRAVPTTEEVGPWIEAIGRLWDDPEFEARHRASALAEASRWDADRLAADYEQLFRDVAGTAPDTK